MSKTIQEELEAKMPGIPEIVVETVYSLYYRFSSHPIPHVKHFKMKSTDMRIVMDRCKKHCERMNYRFVRVEPFMSNFDHDERRQMGGEGELAQI